MALFRMGFVSRGYRGWPTALPFFISLIASPQNSNSNWKEYVYASDGFAISAPSDPKPHTDVSIPDATAYTVGLPTTNETMTLRVMHQPRDCKSYLSQLKDGFRAGKEPGTDPSSLKDISIDGHPGVQYEWSTGSAEIFQVRYYCVNNQFYVFSIRRPINRQLSRQATHVLSSFRLVTPTQDWQEIANNELGFRVRFPGNPESLMNGRRLKVVTDNNSVAYTLFVFDLASTEKRSSAQIFDQAAAAGAKQVKGEITSQSDISLDGVPGREVLLDGGDWVGSLRFYATKSRLYELTFVTAKPLLPVRQPIRDQFFASFALLK